MKTYQKILFSCLLFLLAFQADAQFLERQLISPFGQLSQTNLLSVSATGGELAIQTIKTWDQIFTVGFQQPNPEDIVRTADPKYQSLEIILSPNPLFQRFTIRFNTDRDFKAFYVIWDSRGNTVQNSTAFQLNAMTMIGVNCSSWEGGSYYVSIFDEDKRLVRSMKVLKM